MSTVSCIESKMKSDPRGPLFLLCDLLLELTKFDKRRCACGKKQRRQRHECGS